MLFTVSPVWHSRLYTKRLRCSYKNKIFFFLDEHEGCETNVWEELTSHSLPTTLEQCIMDNYHLPRVWMFVSAHRQSLDLSFSLTDSNCMAEENYFLKACHEDKLHFSQFFLSPTILSYFFPPSISVLFCHSSTVFAPRPWHRETRDILGHAQWMSRGCRKTRNGSRGRWARVMVNIRNRNLPVIIHTLRK